MEMPDATSVAKADLTLDDKSKNQTKPFVTDIVWGNVIFMSMLHAGAVYSLSLLSQVRIWTILWMLLLFSFGGWGVTAGVHRHWSHRSFKAKLPLKIIMMLFHCISGQSSLYDWVRKHRLHHKYSETDADPHNSHRGFFFSHMGWLLLRSHPEVIKKGKSLDLSDIMSDSVVTFQLRYLIPLTLLMSITLPTGVPLLWNEDIVNAFFVAFVLRYVMTLHFTWFINSFAHMWGDRPYDSSIRPVDNKWISLTSFGEGFHNFHHAFPFDYRSSPIPHAPNICGNFIEFFAKIGWAYDLRTAPERLVQRRKMRTGSG